MEQIVQDRFFNIPNTLTMIRIALLPLVAWMYQKSSMINALIVYLIAMATDVADGVIARRTHQITSFGKLLDPLADKLLQLLVLGLFVGDGQIPIWIFVVILLKELLMVIGSVISMRHGVIVSALPIGKVTTFVFVMSFVTRFLQMTVAADLLMYLSVAMSVIALVWYMHSCIAKLLKNDLTKITAVR